MAFGASFAMKQSRSSFMRGVITLGSGYAFGAAIIALASPILSRIYTPEDYAISGIFMAIAFIAAPFGTLKYNISIIIGRTERTAFNGFILSFRILFFMLILMYLLIFGFFGYDYFFQQDFVEIHPVLLLAPIGMLLFVSDSEILRGVIIRLRRDKLLGAATATRGVVMSGLRIGLGVLNYGPWGLVLGFLAGHAASIAIYALPVRAWIKQYLPLASRIATNRVARAYYRQPLYHVPAQFTVMMAGNAPVLFMTPFFGATIIGSFYFGEALASQLMSIYYQTVPPLMTREAARRRRAGMPILPFMARILAIVGVPALGLAVVLAFYSVPLVTFVFGDKWEIAGFFVGYMGFTHVGAGLFATISSVTSLLSIQSYILFVQTARLAAIVAAITVGGQQDDVERMVLLMAGSTAFVYAMGIFAIFLAIWRDDRRAFKFS
jgi:O-antigen/teichoic acid export membrane protein